jgi:hypothetical protein
VVGAEAERGLAHPAAKQCGVTADALPYHVLIGADGKVAAVGLQGPELDEAIIKLLPPGKEKSEDKDTKPDDQEKKTDETEQDEKKPRDEPK